MLESNSGPVILLLCLLGACGGERHYRVDDSPRDCSPGEETEREVTPECGNEHCTCTSAGLWQCISPPCTPIVGVPSCTPGTEFIDQVRQGGQLCSRTCVCTRQGPHKCGEFGCSAPDPAVVASGADPSATNQEIPEPCRLLDCPEPGRLVRSRDDGDFIVECAHPDTGPSTIRRRCRGDGQWEQTVLEGGGKLEVRTLFAQGRSWQQTFAFNGSVILSCVPTPAPPGSVDCEVTGAAIVTPECWKRARLPADHIRVLSSATELARLVPCAPADAVDWSHTRVVALRQRVSRREKLVLKVRPFADRTDVVAVVEKRCASRRDRNQPEPKPAVRDLQALIPIPYDGTRLAVRIEHSDGYCLARP